MEENENLDDLSIFDNDNMIDLSFDGSYDTSSLDDDGNEIVEDKDETDNEAVEDESSEEVDSGEDDTNSEESDSNESSPNLYSSTAAFLQEQGIIPSLESSENIKTPDDFAEAFKKEIEIQALKKAENYINNLDVEKVAQSKKQNIELDSVTEDYLKDNLEAAKNLIYQDYLNQGLSDDRAKKQLKKAIDLGEDVVLEEAIESLASLKEFNSRQVEAERIKATTQIKEQEAEQIRLDTELKNRIYNSKEIVKGLPLTKAIQDRVYSSMTEIVAKNPETGQLENKFMQDRSKDPLDFDTRMYYLYELTKGFTDFKNVVNQTKSKAVTELETVLRKTKFEDNGIPDYLQDKDSYGGIGSELVY